MLITFRLPLFPHPLSKQNEGYRHSFLSVFISLCLWLYQKPWVHTDTSNPISTPQASFKLFPLLILSPLPDHENLGSHCESCTHLFVPPAYMFAISRNWSCFLSPTPVPRLLLRTSTSHTRQPSNVAFPHTGSDFLVWTTEAFSLPWHEQLLFSALPSGFRMNWLRKEREEEHMHKFLACLRLDLPVKKICNSIFHSKGTIIRWIR